jgi:hypothetical protein
MAVSHKTHGAHFGKLSASPLTCLPAGTTVRPPGGHGGSLKHGEFLLLLVSYLSVDSMKNICIFEIFIELSDRWALLMQGTHVV